MKKEYDFSKGKRGKFYRSDASFELPIYLNKKLSRFYSEMAEGKSVELTTLINTILSKQMEIQIQFTAEKKSTKKTPRK